MALPGSARLARLRGAPRRLAPRGRREQRRQAGRWVDRARAETRGEAVLDDDARQRGDAVHARRILRVPRGVAARHALEHGRVEPRVAARASFRPGRVRARAARVRARDQRERRGHHGERDEREPSRGVGRDGVADDARGNLGEGVRAQRGGRDVRQVASPHLGPRDARASRCGAGRAAAAGRVSFANTERSRKDCRGSVALCKRDQT